MHLEYKSIELSSCVMKRKGTILPAFTKQIAALNEVYSRGSFSLHLENCTNKMKPYAAASNNLCIIHKPHMIVWVLPTVRLNNGTPNPKTYIAWYESPQLAEMTQAV